MIEYFCEGCGRHVCSIVMDKIPPHHMCHPCAFVEFMVSDLKIRQELHVHLGHMKALNK